jgi:hypothetical protein
MPERDYDLAEANRRIAETKHLIARQLEMIAMLRAEGRGAEPGLGITAHEPALLDAGRPIGDARVPQAIGQPFDRLVPTEAEARGARGADRPATLSLAELK